MQRSRICVAVDDASLRHRVHRALVGVAHELLDIDAIAEPSAVRRVGDERLVIVVGSRVGGTDVTPAAVHRLRASGPLVPIIVCVPPRDPLLRRLGDLAVAGVDRVVALGAPDEDTDLRRDVQEVLKHILPHSVDLGVDASTPSRGVAAELWCARNGYAHLVEFMLADHFNVDRRTILRAVKKEGWRDVESLMRASRFLHAGAELDRPLARPVAIARSLHFGSPSALHHLVKRATGQTAHQLQFEGALQLAIWLWRDRDRGSRV